MLSPGFSLWQIVFDSPCKTYQEIREALLSGVTLNANTFNELRKVHFTCTYMHMYPSSLTHGGPLPS